MTVMLNVATTAAPVPAADSAPAGEPDSAGTFAALLARSSDGSAPESSEDDQANASPAGTPAKGRSDADTDGRSTSDRAPTDGQPADQGQLLAALLPMLPGQAVPVDSGTSQAEAGQQAAQPASSVSGIGSLPGVGSMPGVGTGPEVGSAPAPGAGQPVAGRQQSLGTQPAGAAQPSDSAQPAGAARLAAKTQPTGTVPASSGQPATVPASGQPATVPASGQQTTLPATVSAGAQPAAVAAAPTPTDAGPALTELALAGSASHAGPKPAGASGASRPAGQPAGAPAAQPVPAGQPMPGTDPATAQPGPSAPSTPALLNGPTSLNGPTTLNGAISPNGTTSPNDAPTIAATGTGQPLQLGPLDQPAGKPTQPAAAGDELPVAGHRGKASQDALGVLPAGQPDATTAPSAPAVPSLPPATQLPPAQLPPVAQPQLASQPQASQPMSALAQPVAQQLTGPLLRLRASGDGSHSLTIALHPAELGPVNLHVKLAGDTMTIQLASTSESARDALRDALPQLHQELQAAGLPSAGLSLELGGQAAGGSAGFATPERQPQVPAQPAGETPAGKPESRPRRAESGLDRWL